MLGGEEGRRRGGRGRGDGEEKEREVKESSRREKDEEHGQSLLLGEGKAKRLWGKFWGQVAPVRDGRGLSKGFSRKWSFRQGVLPEVVLSAGNLGFPGTRFSIMLASEPGFLCSNTHAGPWEHNQAGS